MFGKEVVEDIQSLLGRKGIRIEEVKKKRGPQRSHGAGSSNKFEEWL